MLVCVVPLIEQTFAVPLTTPGVAGVTRVTVKERLAVVLHPPTKTETDPVVYVEENLNEMVFVPCPVILVEPAGNVHV